MTSIILIGPRCTGKTAIGRELSEILNIPLIDGDEEFIKQYGPIDEFIKKNKGDWKSFRYHESKIIEYVCKNNSNIIFTPGGGAVAHDQGEIYRKHNQITLQNFGKVIYILPDENLEKSAIILTERFLNDPKSKNNRPSLSKESNHYKEMLDIIKKWENFDLDNYMQGLSKKV